MKNCRDISLSLSFFLIKSKENQEQNKGFLVCFVSKWDTDCAGWSKDYLQLTHTTCLTKHKPKRNEKKKKKKTGYAVEWDIYFYFIFRSNSSMQNLWRRDLKTIKKKTIRQNNKEIYRIIESNTNVSLWL
jgi:hypothetical protein